MISLPARTSTVIFDLGGVIVDLSIENTANAFARLAGITQCDVFHVYQSNDAFNAFEKGEIKNDEFRDFIRKVFSATAPNSEIDGCWNAMLVGLPTQKLKLLEKLKTQFKTLLLSNTNGIHLSYIEDVMLKGACLDDYFHKAYYSHKVGMRKPDSIIFEHVLADNVLDPSQTVFLDDNKENIDAAKSAGIHTIYITQPDMVYDIFKKYD
jgi:putative hydrolase of the HAD superfamily